MRDSTRRPPYFLASNWLLFFAVSLWTSITQGSLLWWLRLGWGNWLSEFSSLAQLQAIPAGSIWILWLMLSLISTALHWVLAFQQNQEPVNEKNPLESHLHSSNADLIDARPELKEKLLRLHQSLDRI
jgi:hypothetical protein